MAQLTGNDMRTEQHAIDRRTARTRATLQDALLALIEEKPYDAITIKEICEAANVGRSTFYAHFTSKDGLKRAGLDHLRSELLRYRDKKCRFGFGRALFEHARNHLHLYRALRGTRGAVVALSEIRQMLTDSVRHELAALDDVDIATQYVVGAYMAVLTWWLDSGARQAPKEIDAIVRRLTTQTLQLKS